MWLPTHHAHDHGHVQISGRQTPPITLVTMTTMTTESPMTKPAMTMHKMINMRAESRKPRPANPKVAGWWLMVGSGQLRTHTPCVLPSSLHDGPGAQTKGKETKWRLTTIIVAVISRKSAVKQLDNSSDCCCSHTQPKVPSASFSSSSPSCLIDEL